jgi:hypothetical protein
VEDIEVLVEALNSGFTMTASGESLIATPVTTPDSA